MLIHFLCQIDKVIGKLSDLIVADRRRFLTGEGLFQRSPYFRTVLVFRKIPDDLQDFLQRTDTIQEQKQHEGLKKKDLIQKRIDGSPFCPGMDLPSDFFNVV